MVVESAVGLFWEWGAGLNGWEVELFAETVWPIS